MSLCLVLLRPSGINDHGHHLVLFRNACTYKRISQVLYEAHAISVLTEHPHCPFPDKKAAAAKPGHYSWFLNSYPRIQWLGRITEDQSRKKRNISFPHPHSHVIPQCSKSICPDCHKHGRRIRIHIFFVRVLKGEKIKQRVKRCWVGFFFLFPVLNLLEVRGMHSGRPPETPLSCSWLCPLSRLLSCIYTAWPTFQLPVCRKNKIIQKIKHSPDALERGFELWITQKGNLRKREDSFYPGNKRDQCHNLNYIYSPVLPHITLHNWSDGRLRDCSQNPA